MSIITRADEQAAVNDATRNLNRLINNSPVLRNLFASNQANYRYYAKKGSKDRYFYTVHKITHCGHPRFVSGVYRFYKTKKVWKPLYQAGHAKKKDAMDRALRLMKVGK